ncbi:MAG: hypothetical protein KIC73_16045 [Clostridiales bacterium]|nr:hypothetical protein [Clostridiales bacterium]
MAKYGVTNIAGGGGIGSDEVSVTKEYVLNGKTYVGSDTNDEIGTGTMANNGATGNQSLNAGGSFSVKKGYHAQDFIINANGLASQTPGNAIPSHVLNGESYWANGNKLTGTMNVQSILSFSCAPYSASQIIFTWKNPSSGPFSGVIIVGKTGGYPASLSDGTWYYKGYGNNTSPYGVSSTVLGGFAVNVTYYFRVFSYAVINGSDSFSATTTAYNTTIQQVTQVFTSSTTWTAPPNVNIIDVFCVGGGGSGSGAGAGNDSWGGGGGGGYTTTVKNLQINPNTSYSIIIGSGGEGTPDNTWTGRNGNPTTFGGNLVVANGGKGGAWYGGNGGSGGGGGADRGNYWEGESANGGNGGSNGGSGYGGAHGHNSGSASGGGTGQGTTTTAFAENNGTRYSGGGGGGGSSVSSGAGWNGAGGWGGDYGGGRGGGFGYSHIGAPGTPNSGGGSGGGTNGFVSAGSGNGGSGICIIRYIGNK